MIKTINLSANTEQAVEVTGGVHGRFENMGDGTVYVSKTANVTAGGDGVIAVSGGTTKYMKNVAAYGEYDGEYGYQGTVYVKADTACKVEIETGDYFFKSVNSGKGGAVSGKFVKIKGRVGTVDDLPLIADEGDLYFVGAELDEDSDEYVYTADGKWELIGNTEVDLSGYVKDTDIPSTMAKYGVETNTVPAIESDVAENRFTLGYSGKNLLDVENSTTTKTGITFTVNNDKSITINGTCGTPYSDFYLMGSSSNSNPIWSNSKGNFVLTTNSEQTSKFIIHFYSKSDNNIIKSCYPGNVTTITPDILDRTTWVFIRVLSNQTLNNFTIYPMLRSASITDDTYEPYKASVDERLNDISIVETISKSCNTTSAGDKYLILYRMPKNNTSGHHSVSFIMSDLGNTGKSSTGIWICQISNIGNSAHFNVRNLIPADNCKFGWYADNDYFYFGIKQPGWNGYSVITRLTPKNQISTAVVELMQKTTTQPTGWTEVTEL